MENETTKISIFSVVGWGINTVLFCLLMFYALTSCTYTVTLAHTEGTATDLIDEVSTNTPNFSADVKMPGIL